MCKFSISFSSLTLCANLHSVPNGQEPLATKLTHSEVFSLFFSMMEAADFDDSSPFILINLNKSKTVTETYLNLLKTVPLLSN